MSNGVLRAESRNIETLNSRVSTVNRLTKAETSRDSMHGSLTIVKTFDLNERL